MQLELRRMEFELCRMQFGSRRMEFELCRMQFGSRRMEFELCRMQFGSRRMQFELRWLESEYVQEFYLGGDFFPYILATVCINGMLFN